MKNLVAVIVGGTGQFGIITSEFLLKKNYKVIVTTRSINKKRKLFRKHRNLRLNKLNIYSKKKINKLLYKYKPSLIFYYAGQSSPKKSFLHKIILLNIRVSSFKKVVTIVNQRNKEN